MRYASFCPDNGAKKKEDDNVKILYYLVSDNLSEILH